MPSTDFVFPATDALLSQNLATSIDATGIQNQIRTTENDNLTSSLNLANTNSNQALIYGMYLSRNKTISDAAVDLTVQNKMFDNGTSETYARQGEINEWQAQNKFDTLFFLQCVFIYLVAFIILVYIWRKGLLPSSTYYYVIIILTVVLICIFWNRYMYTTSYRDKRYWNRRYLGLDSSLNNTPPETCESSADGTAEATTPASANPI
jgi:galactokinase